MWRTLWRSKVRLTSLLICVIHIYGVIDWDLFYFCFVCLSDHFFFKRYAAARQQRRKIIAHVGPTNSGKTFGALQAFMKAPSGLYCGPLRLLAHEVYEKVEKKKKKKKNLARRFPLYWYLITSLSPGEQCWCLVQPHHWSAFPHKLGGKTHCLHHWGTGDISAFLRHSLLTSFTRWQTFQSQSIVRSLMSFNFSAIIIEVGLGVVPY